MKKIVATLLCLQILLLATSANVALAQDSSEDVLKTTQNDIMIVGLSAVGGAVLGLSTFSFVETPSKHVANIWTGAALGIIAGVIFVAYNSAQKNSEDLQSSREFNSSERVAWHSENTENLTLPAVQFGTQIWQTSF